MLTKSLTERTDLWIDGRWHPTTGDDCLTVIEPSTERAAGRVPAGTSEDVDRAVAAAAAAFPRWSAAPPKTRVAFLERLLAGLEARADDFTALACLEVGAPVTLARALHVGFGLQTVRSYLQVLADYPLEERLGSSLVVREPIGVVVCITPWNLPLALILQKVVPALAAGCTTVLKPSEVAPLNAFLLADVLADCDLPAGVFNLVSGDGPGVGEALAAHPLVDMVTLTGSTRAGRRVAELAAPTTKRVHLELGGKNANIILSDADLASAVRSSVDQLCVNSGQTCLAWSRMFVQDTQHAQAAALAVEAADSYRVGDPYDPASDLGPLVSEAALNRVRRYIGQGIEEGADLRTGGIDRPADLDRGYYVRPTVFAGVRNDMTLAQEEIFGPVLSIIPYRDTDAAVRMANTSPYGLHGSVWSGSDHEALAVARRLRTGQVDINGAPLNFIAPFGGYRQSGLGRQCGPYGLDEYHELKAIQLAAPDALGDIRGSVRLHGA
ncbi:3-succinoylsemialdehyde-pyridine dehydrogenase (plasmid) [Streptomyces sp. YIM 121038]|uniref:aldehyde dehydrogenase family protein n=1 Tax=Streptomyces sp. YIM 121038 TaxID=2136401 RepID=UPI001110F802|nr:aldehyde dehydrogenase family protein [Streptomyces sp. YIM 121038]QCX82712.1 3-succinoylsemialdehyde-pyridine dehydrogenase [Streptomyces sp. YIM 121038]